MNIIITGASRGIGFELAKQFAAQGNHNIIAIARNVSKLKELKSVCIRENIEAHLFPVVFDLADDNISESNLLDTIKTHIPKADILINNAGYLVNTPLNNLSEDDLWRMIRVNFAAPALLIKLLLPLFNQGGHIVNIGSMGGFQGSSKFSGLSVYSATKAALASLTECLAEELKETGISFNCLALGAVATEMLAEAFPGYTPPLSTPEMAKFICDFALNGNKYFNGKVLPVSSSTP